MDENTALQSRDPKVLEDEIMNPNIPKNDREWWASHEIEKLRNGIMLINSLIDFAQKNR